MEEKKPILKMSKPQQEKSKKGSIKKGQSKIGQLRRWSIDSFLVVDGITKWPKLKV
jgi:hypothetical protein